MKRILLSLALLVCLLPSADARKDRPGKQRLRQEEKQAYQARIDSLRRVVDSLEYRLSIADSVQAENGFLQPEGMEDARPDSLTASRTDSLMSIWYHQRRLSEYDAPDYDMDSVRFSSNVSDEVMMERLKQMNSYITLPFNSTVKNYMILYAEKMPKKMAHILGLSAYYMPIFEETFDRYHLPLELKYMAVIESMLNPVAESRVGARGMWQFMYRTARNYGLKINSFVDERLDVEKAVDAAARYLSDAYNTFGDWNLAISSYNCGPGNVTKAIRRAGSREFWDIYPYLPRETRGYVPAFVGAMYAMTYYREYGIVPEKVALPVQTDTMEIRRNLHFQQISEVVGIPMQDLKNLNPQYTHNIIPGNEGVCILKIPFNWTPAFMEADTDSLYLHKSDKLLNPQVIKNIKESGSEVRTAYRVKNGDYLGKIAAKYRVSVNQIMKWNHLRSTNIRPGQVLYIYHRGAGPSDVRPAKSSSGSQSKTSGQAKPSTAAQAKSSSSQNGASYVTYQVRSGDTLYAIAKKYPGVSANDIMKYNNIGATIRPGMKLKIPVK